MVYPNKSRKLVTLDKRELAITLCPGTLLLSKHIIRRTKPTQIFILYIKNIHIGDTVKHGEVKIVAGEGMPTYRAGVTDFSHLVGDLDLDR